MDENEPVLKSFNPKVMLGNVNLIRKIIQRIRQSEGSIDSTEDELVLHRCLQDIDLLVDMADGLKASYDSVKTERDDLAAQNVELEAQLFGLEDTYEKILRVSKAEIKGLREELNG